MRVNKPTTDLRNRKPHGALLRKLLPRLLFFVLVATAALAGCSPEAAMEAEPGEQEPAEAEPTHAQEEPVYTLSPPTPAPTASPSTILVEAEPQATTTDALGQINFEYPVRMSPLASDTAILELGVPELLVAAEPMAVTRVEHKEPAGVALGHFDAVVYLAPRMFAELTSPAFEVEPLTPELQDVDLHLTDQPTTWAWTLRAPDVTGKQVMTLRLFRENDPVPLWIGSFRSDVVAERQLDSSLSTDEQAAEAQIQSDTITAAPTGVIPRVIEAVTQDITTVLMGILGLLGTIIAAMVAAWVERGNTRRSDAPSGRSNPYRKYPSSALRALWFRLSQRVGTRKRRGPRP